MGRLTRRALSAKAAEKAARSAASGVAIYGTRDAQDAILFRLMKTLGGEATWLGRLVHRIWLSW